ncbi:hypothetical protein B0H13DRAFT_2292812 [Mycena leptocephala]|nr:hypothetical protein B0H13DRAFT_2292812 [Mycena leptocephala]
MPGKGYRSAGSEGACIYGRKANIGTIKRKERMRHRWRALQSLAASLRRRVCTRPGPLQHIQHPASPSLGLVCACGGTNPAAARGGIMRTRTRTWTRTLHPHLQRRARAHLHPNSYPDPMCMCAFSVSVSRARTRKLRVSGGEEGARAPDLDIDVPCVRTGARLGVHCACVARCLEAEARTTALDDGEGEDGAEGEGDGENICPDPSLHLGLHAHAQDISTGKWGAASTAPPPSRVQSGIGIMRECAVAISFSTSRVDIKRTPSPARAPPSTQEPGTRARADDVRSSVYLSARGKSAGFDCTQAGKRASTWGVSIG